MLYGCGRSAIGDHNCVIDMSYYHASILLVSFFYHMKVNIVLDGGVEPHGCGEHGGGGEPGSASR